MQAIKVFVISLKKSIKRREYIASQLKKENIEFEFFDAIDGRVDDFPLFHQYDYFKRLWLTSGKMPSKGELGCYASHYSLWGKCVSLDEPIIVIEDDSELISGAEKLLNNIRINVIKYGFLRLEDIAKGKTVEKEINDDYKISYMFNNFGGTRSYAINVEASKALLSCARWCMPVDNYIGSNYIHQMPSFLFSPSLVLNSQEFGSTIQLGEEKKCPLYRKLTRELYSCYRNISMLISNKKLCKKF